MPTPHEIDEQFEKAWCPFFCRAGRGAVDVDEFAFEVDGWLPRLDVLRMLVSDGRVLSDVVHRKIHRWRCLWLGHAQW